MLLPFPALASNYADTTLERKEGERLSLDCQTAGQPPPSSTSWVLTKTKTTTDNTTGTIQQTTTEQPVGNSSSPTSATVTIASIMLHDQGVYSCRSMLLDYSKVLQTVNVTVTSGKTPTCISVLPLQLEVMCVLHDFVFYCTVFTEKKWPQRIQMVPLFALYLLL